MTANVLPSYGASHATLEGIKSEMNDKASQKLVFGDSPLMWKSPWILPAYVVSNEQDAEKRPIVQVAKCTIDTGNMQGNIVSRSFVELLGFPSSMFDKLTEEEARGGSGITGDPHIPQGAIYLTWYHNNSTRVFRNMRFLISPSDSCDLIIGAWSVRKDKILDVPCLMAPREPREKPSQRVRIIITAVQKKDPLLNELYDIEDRVRDDWQDRKLNLKENHKPQRVTKLTTLAQQSQMEVDVAGWLLEVYEIYKNERHNAEKLHEAVEIWEELDLIWHLMRNHEPDDIQKELEKFYQLLKKELNLVDNRDKGKNKI